jgi:DNA-binding MarR family transcriptional regulator
VCRGGGALCPWGCGARGGSGRDPRRRIVDITADRRPAIEDWLSHGGAVWRRVLEPLSPAERALVVRTLRAYESAFDEG